jgi:hypothetical protein
MLYYSFINISLIKQIMPQAAMALNWCHPGAGGRFSMAARWAVWF